MPLYPCSACGKPIDVPESRRKKSVHIFCSDKCRRTPCVPIKCVVCGCTFLVAARGAGDAKYCSRDCFLAHNRQEEVHKKAPKITRTCQHCGKQFDVRKSVGRNASYCSKECFHASGKLGGIGSNNPHWKEKVLITCAYCGKEFETVPSRGERKKYCCKKHAVLGNLKRFASGQRTDIESAMADALRKNRIAFGEQIVMFDKFMVDFKLTNYPIIVQCDGVYWHSSPDAKRRDKGQDAYLVKAGYVVLRFTDRQVLHQMPSCIQLIKQTIKNPHQPRLVQG